MITNTDSGSAIFSAILHDTELLVITTVIAGISYGFPTTLCFNCFSLLLKSKHLPYSRRMRPFFLFYVAVMFLLGTGAMIEEIGFVGSGIIALGATSRTSRSAQAQNKWDPRMVPYTLPLIIWGADGLLVRIMYVSRTNQVQ
ncbi:hypothetical protein CPC08DRAFT_708420 [Agrocybe pediades]|nr:hypothetical protein CPC08DRAFT_708420 [Agrocybe pediades]